MSKPLGRKNYGSVPHLSNSKLGTADHFVHEGQERILTIKKRDKHDKILVFEKYDGSNIGVAKKDGKIYALTRSGYEAKTSPYKQHHLFHDWVYSVEGMFLEILGEGERVAGEWLAQAHGLKYSIFGCPVLFFDYFDNNNKRKEFNQLINTGLVTPRLIHEGNSESVESLIPKLNNKTKSFMSEDLPEGMVYRVERKGKFDFMAKWVRSDFQAGKYCIGVDDKDLVWNIKGVLND